MQNERNATGKCQFLKGGLHISQDQSLQELLSLAVILYSKAGTHFKGKSQERVHEEHTCSGNPMNFAVYMNRRENRRVKK